MNFRPFYSFLISWTLLVTFCCASETEKGPKAVLKVHSVGQGNCVSLEVKDAQGRSEYMLVDIGSSAYANEAAYTQFQSSSLHVSLPSEKDAEMAVDKAQEVGLGGLAAGENAAELLSPFSTPVKEATKLTIPSSTIKESNWAKTQKDKQEIFWLRKTFVDDFILNMRTMLASSDEPKQLICVKTVVITHPDWDHYSWLMRLFCNKKDKINFLILGGLPSHYYEEDGDRVKFTRWLSQRLKNGCKIFFPAVQYDPLDPSDISDPLKRVLEKEKKGIFAPHTFSEAHNFSELSFAKAFNFGSNVVISLLALNPIHFEDAGHVTRCANDDKDDNRDSIVFRIQYEAFSAMLMGDATEATTRRIKSNYRDKLHSLRSSVLLASHHGSAEEGCNNEEWIELVAPQYVLISNGWNKKYGHPREQAYENFKKSPNLKTLNTTHQVLVGRGMNKNGEYYDGGLHHTYRAIFSTLNSGTLTFTLDSKEMYFECQTKPSEDLAVGESVTKVIVLESQEKVVMSLVKEKGFSEAKKLILLKTNSLVEKADSKEEKKEDALSTSLIKRKGKETTDLVAKVSLSKRSKKKKEPAPAAASSELTK